MNVNWPALVNHACSKNPNLIIDIGAAEGYYAIGLAVRNPSSRVIASRNARARSRCVAKYGRAKRSRIAYRYPWKM